MIFITLIILQLIIMLIGVLIGVKRNFLKSWSLVIPVIQALISIVFILIN